MKAAEERRAEGVKRKGEMQEEGWREGGKSGGTGSGKGLRRKGEKRSHLKSITMEP